MFLSLSVVCVQGHLPPITKTIQVRRTRHAGHCWRSSDVLLWTPAYGQAKAGRPARTYIQQPCEDTGCSPEDLPKAMNDREKWRERIRDIRASGTTWWWWWWCMFRLAENWLLRECRREDGLPLWTKCVHLCLAYKKSEKLSKRGMATPKP